MAEYEIVPDGLRAYGVEITWRGGFRSVRGFATKTDAQAWIDEERRRDPLGLDPNASDRQRRPGTASGPSG
jgi:hypothetical protein